jgi:digeranylgeranylglycerophospholipid reductase
MRKEYDVVVVGAGPAGSIAARYAAERGVSVLMLEKDRDVGYPVRCGEAISKEGLLEFIEPDSKFIASEINNFCFVAPDGTEVLLPLKNAGYILERRIFDYELAKKAAEKGVQVLTRAYVNNLIMNDGTVKGVIYQHQGKEHEIRSKVVIAADGVESRVGRWAGLKTYTDFRDMECCVQITASGIDIDEGTCYFYFGKEYAPNGYFWIFPKGKNTANIGLGVAGDIGKKRSALSFLNSFMEKNYPNASVLTRIAGGVPCTLRCERISAPGLLLVGDAARQVNPLSGGGITSGMLGGAIGGSLAAASVIENNPDLLLTYEKEWDNGPGKRYKRLDRIKEGIYKFSDEKFNSIARSVIKTPVEKRTLNKVFSTALIDQPKLLIDIAKVFMNR